MKIQPLKRAREPRYPTMEEARRDPLLLARMPVRWEKNSAFAACLGLFVVSAQASETPLPDHLAAAAASVSPDRRPLIPESSVEARKVASIVAPLLDEALENDGRGSFGCIAINPPSFLSEDEALELIREELEAAGLELEYGTTLDAVPAPVDGAEAVNSFGPRPFENQPAKLALQKYSFDWGDADRSVYIEYLSRRDHGAWMKEPCSTVSSYDFPDVARRVVQAFGKYRSDRPVYFGVFFDPLAHSGVLEPPVTGLDTDLEEMAKEESRKLRKADGNADARDKLRRQVRHFVEFLKKEGVAASPE